MIEYLIFAPDKTKDMRLEYPELAEVVEFKDLSDSELKFVWFVACKASPIVRHTVAERDKISRALEFSGHAKSLAQEDYVKWVGGFLPEKISVAMSIMNSFSPSIRMEALIAQQTIFRNLLEIAADKPAATDEIAKKKAYADIVLDISSKLPAVIKEIEQAYGIKIKGETTTKGGKKLIDELLTSKH